MIELILVSIFGLIIGSFLNCVMWRIYKEESFLVGKSYCPHCRHSLGFWDLIPALSFLFLGGKCRYCKKPISWQYPMVELFTSALFVLAYLQFHPVILFSYPFWQMIFWCLMISFFIIIFVFDVKYYIIPDEVIYPSIVLSLVWIAYSYFIGVFGLVDVMQFALSALGASAFFFSIWFFSKGLAMGFGDVKLAFLLGLLMGWPNIIVALFLGFFFGAIIGLVMMVMKKKGLESEIPFGPFLLVGTLLTLFWGSGMINWYLSLI